ncbi:Uncharacterized protein Cadr_000006548 [Camelus dromedarius]|uniref:Aftiphilin clathrin-binding box domain-containing protein n=1 Tax=Camelus dromedarius TaxID=9838 RepID=A0A5N4E2B7_CAMDR|nr:uncharacterized protein CLBA1 [Camelus dromedarius]KAB1277430.1 Uncharacterized protein Cadr_000006548 [Camelus dromedarius]
MSPERLPSGSVRTWRHQHTRPTGAGGAAGQMPPLCAFLSELAEEAGEVSKDSGASPAPGRQSGDAGQWAKTCSLLPSSGGAARVSGRGEGLPTRSVGGPDPGERSGAWGEFEGFRESSAKSEQFSRSFELPERPAETQLPRTTSAPKEYGSRQPHQGGPWATGTATISPSELLLSYENIFKFAFQEVPIQQVTEAVSTLDGFLEASKEEAPGLEPVQTLCSESRKLWRALQNSKTILTSQCLWSESRCQENFLLVLGIDAAQKSRSTGQGHTQEDPNLQGRAESTARSCHLPHCGALIQTQLTGTPGSRQGSLITYSLFLKTPFHGNRQFTIPRKKKIFTPRNLKMTLFNSDVC